MKFLATLLLVSPLHADWFYHRVLPSNSSSNWSRLTRHLTEEPAQRVFIHPRTLPGGPDHPDRNLGVFFTSGSWAVFYENQASAPPSPLEFSVFTPAAGDTMFLHTHHSGAQPTFKRSYIDHPSLNGSPDVLLFLTHNWTAGGGTYNNQFSPVTYDPSSSKWFIHGYIPSDEFTDVPDGATWNVLVVPAVDETTFRHTATTGNTTGPSTTLDHPHLNGNPSALVLVTNQWPTDFVGATFSMMQPTYDDSLGRWKLTTTRNVSIQTGSVFHIKVSPAPVTPEPTISISYSSPTATLKLPTEFGYTYQLKTSPDLGTFNPEGLPFNGNGTIRSYPTSVVLPENFYQLHRTLGEVQP